MNILGTSYPPSAGAFSGEAFIATKDDTSFLVRTVSPPYAQGYPYFDHASDPEIGDNIANFSVAISAWLAKCPKESLREQRKCTHVQMTRQTLHSFGEEWDARTPDCLILIYTLLFEMLNEDKKPAGEEQSIGLFNLDPRPVYQNFESC